jgi:hypothetical protein
VELLDMVGNLPKRYSFKIEIECESDYFRIELNPAESLIDNKPVVAVMATISLDLTVRRSSDPALYDVWTFTNWTSDGTFISDYFVRFNISFNVYFKLQGELDGKNMFADYIPCLMIGTRT